MKPPAGFRVRRPVAGDETRVAELIRATELGEGVEAETEETDVSADWRVLDLVRDAWLVEADDGRPAGYLIVHRHREARVRSDGYVHPDFAGHGIGRLLLRLGEARARELAELEEEGVQVLLHNGVLESNAAAVALLGSEGYRAARWFRRMVIDLDRPPAAPAAPEGIVIRAFKADGDARAFHAAREEAFEEHWDAMPLDAESWWERAAQRQGFDPTLWFLAAAEDEIAGIAECRWKVMGKGFVDTLGVRPSWRGRGVGLALLQRSFAEFYGRGERTVFLFVDADNPTGATRLYERAGMRADWAALVFEKELRAGRPLASGRA